ncbi:ABC transporter ATP-binding protein [Galbibacter pacificus]|uniref:ABC transporter ATP-binding protein n=1 Tax=Galbibacter pacificus TaxID=2996052 RepID=A0ABT6FM71_9FLAO|nr:ABC transporter ATP-binding protein [Galbibacter pacificus]MDG3580809.1 ABC transporter ATP-binding protein [Galbibacter pacificus]MDG3584287.1 ABC transporter ATP-binding protein [Galbibacter pacificus]
MPRKLASIKDQKKEKTSVKDSFAAFKYIPRFSSEIWKTHKTMYLINTLARLINAFAPIALLWVGKLIIDEIITQINASGKDFSLLWKYVALELSLALISDLISRLITLTDSLLGDLYANKSSVSIIKKTNEIGIDQLEDPDFYDKLERARTQTTSRVNLMSNILSQVQSVISMVSLIAGLIYFEPVLILILILSIIPSFINEIKFSSQSYSLARSWTSERRELDYLRFVGANDKTAKEIKLFGLTNYIADRFKALSDEYYQLNKKLAIKRSTYGAVFNLLGVLSYYAAYILIIYRVLTGVITIGELTFLSGSFNRLRNNLQGFFSRFTNIAQSALYLKDYFDFIDLDVEKDHSKEVPIPSEITEGFFIDNVAFSYPGSNERVLSGVSFTLKSGEKMAFVGQNGAGKTTLIKLILRFYEPTSGTIYLDGTDIRKFNKDKYQKMFGVIFQDFFRYEFTVQENIAVGKIDEIENMGRIENAAELSLASEVVKELDKGYKQQLGKRFNKGQELSGGQWQKIALARAYMKDAAILILDEPTSALDAKAEFEVFERFMGLTKGKTSIIISHRFSTVRMADRILVLKDGKILEIGTHETLMKNKNLYAELFSLQAAGYQ